MTAECRGGPGVRGLTGGALGEVLCHNQHAGPPPLNPASPLGFTLVVDHAAAAASRSAGAEGGAGSDDWEDVERNLGWVGASSQPPAPIPLASGNLSQTSKGPYLLRTLPKRQPHEASLS